MVYFVVGIALLAIAALIHFAAMSLVGALVLVGVIAIVVGLLFTYAPLPAVRR